MFRYIALVIMISLSNASQAVIIHDESINGDLAGGFTFGPLTDGINTIIGSSTVLSANNAPPLPDFDQFRVSVTENTSITDIVFTLLSFTEDALTPNSAHYSQLQYYIAETTIPWTSFGWMPRIDLESSNVGAATSFQNLIPTNPFPVETGLYFSQAFHGAGIDYSFNWQIDIYANVTNEDDSEPVPEPSAIALMGLGLLGLAATRRKLKK